MVEFLRTDDIISFTGKIIRDANKVIILVSPYLDIRKKFKDLIEIKNNQGIPIIIIYGKKKDQFKLDEDVLEWINSLENVELFFEKDLHAKCYLNESEAIITSMNLYEASQKNVEMGILLKLEEDKKSYRELLDEVKTLMKEESLILNNFKKSGFCIRCGEKIKLNIKHPYCKEDYNSWKIYEDEYYYEKKGVCHICGEKFQSSMKIPCCADCYNKNK